jgi:hypothetical protein
MGILEKIADIEKEIAKTQKNKGKPWQSQYHFLVSNIGNFLTIFTLYDHCE